MQDLLEYLSQQLRQADNMADKTHYRRDLLKALINSYPAGIPIKPREMSVILGYRPDTSSIFTFLHKMRQKGEIGRQSVRGSQSYAYTVLKPGNTYDKERAAVEPEETDTPEELQTFLDKPMDSDPVPMNESVDEPEPGEVHTWTVKRLEEIARTRQFYHKGEPEYVADFLKALWAKEV